jgi:hypothetical protein
VRKFARSNSKFSLYEQFGPQVSAETPAVHIHFNEILPCFSAAAAE